MDHYYAECFGYMPPTTDHGNQRDTKVPSYPIEHDYSHQPIVPRRPTTLQFGTDRQFISSKEAPSYVPDYTLLFPPEAREELRNTISRVTVEESVQMTHSDCEFHSPLSPSTSSSGSTYARSFSDCSPPPSGQLLTGNSGYKLQDMQTEHVPDIDEALFADLSNIETQLCLGPSDPWTTVSCHELSTTADFGKRCSPDDNDIPFGLYHNRQLSSISSVDDTTDSIHENDDGLSTILTTFKATSHNNCDNNARNEPHVVRLVGEKHVEGQGLCYIYSDGTHCPKYIKGEPVNAKWGVTKAGKPRKRLAQACMACRHRKIKCTPGSPKCEQCKRSGKTCRFENAPRGNLAKFRADSEKRPTPSRSPRRNTSGKRSIIKEKEEPATKDTSPNDFKAIPGETWDR
ncbi:hypothetical protein KEM54_000170 [Ascosphaera aggregata]|nr:hypothetical protein KEM54_000170 [Ascosphaera aggregata]